MIITLRASFGAVYCNRSSRWVCFWVCVCVCLWVCYHDNSKLRASILTNVGKGSDHLQLIKCWPSRAPGKGVCGGAKVFGSALLQPARCLRLSGRFFIIIIFVRASATQQHSFNHRFPRQRRQGSTRTYPFWILLKLRRMMDVVMTTADRPIRCAKLQSNRHHQQTNIYLFTGRMPFLSPNQQCQSTEGRKYHIPWTCTPQAHLTSLVLTTRGS